MWDEQVPLMMSPIPEHWDTTHFPRWQKWHERMLLRPAVKKVVEEKQKLRSNAQY